MADESDPRKLFFEALGEEIERFLLVLVASPMNFSTVPPWRWRTSRDTS
jgi:hypothetical protein